MLYGDRDETINYIITECSKRAPKDFKTRYDSVGKVNHKELCNKFKSVHMNKWNMHNQEYDRENKTHKLLWDYEIS